MQNLKFISVVTFVLLLLLFFAPSVYDPSVYAKMKVIEEKDLAKIEGEAGITIGLDLTVNAVATNANLNAGASAINLPSLTIGGGAASNKIDIKTDLLIDVGSSGTRTSLFMNGIALPSTNGINISAVNVNVVSGNVGTTRTLGNLTITGLVMGRGAAATPAYTTDPLWMQLSASSAGTGLEGSMTLGAYIDNILFTYSNATGTPSFGAQGVYIAGLSNPGTGSQGAIDGAPANWTTITGSAQTGGPFTTYWENGAYGRGTVESAAGIDVGRNSSETLLRLRLPQAITLRVKNVRMGSQNLGSTVLQNIIWYRQDMLLKNL